MESKAIVTGRDSELGKAIDSWLMLGASMDAVNVAFGKLKSESDNKGTNSPPR